jgi:glycosyltransferase involved in cell wall biosynthesis
LKASLAPDRVVFVIPGDPESRTGGYIYDRRIMSGLEDRGWRVELCNLGEGFPFPSDSVRDTSAKQLSALPESSLVVVDGLAGGVLPEEMEALTKRCRLVALVHHPLALETGLRSEDRSRLQRSEAEGLAHAHRVIVPGPATARSLTQDYGLEPRVIGVVRPGTDPIPRPQARPTSQPAGIAFLIVATVTPRKGHDLLIEALWRLAGLPWTLTSVGSLDRDPAYARKVLRAIEDGGLTERVHLVGEVAPDRLAHYYQAADAFVLPSYLEGYGMVLADALAQGLPIISTSGGAIPDTVPDDAGILVPPGDLEALTQALERIIRDPALRERLGTAAARAASELPTWPESSANFARELKKVG